MQSPDRAAEMEAALDARLCLRDADADDIVRALLLIAEMRGIGVPGGKRSLSCETLRQQLNSRQPLNFATVLSVMKMLEVRLRAEAF
ncbi:transcriptional regulator [Stenotrophomonas tumulicola]|uniref:Transcriptional regulator n=1 Tax=Stenotrophomonas tumulicola TaxID=1685415 RepID=A0A7W3FKU8_9GAMM|nr:transcriptional regulator [Stenotrophomonas tumulicola]MBA8681437.1 transcriptional regulator [Stenotrophomonas tumulicola]